MNNPHHLRVYDAVKSYVDKARRAFPAYANLIPDLAVTFDVTNPKVAGLAYLYQDRVAFNEDYFKFDDFWKNTIAHEVAHIVQIKVFPRAKQAHGPEFRTIMLMFGCSPKTHHNMETEALTKLVKERRPHSYSCPCCKMTFHLSNLLHKRIQNGQGRICGKCKTRIVKVERVSA